MDIGYGRCHVGKKHHEWWNKNIGRTSIIWCPRVTYVLTESPSPILSPSILPFIFLSISGHEKVFKSIVLYGYVLKPWKHSSYYSPANVNPCFYSILRLLTKLKRKRNWNKLSQNNNYPFISTSELYLHVCHLTGELFMLSFNLWFLNTFDLKIKDVLF